MKRMKRKMTKIDSAIKRAFSNLWDSFSSQPSVNYCYGGELLATPLSSIYVGCRFVGFPLQRRDSCIYEIVLRKLPMGKDSRLCITPRLEIDAMNVLTRNDPAFFPRTIHMLVRNTLQ
jgi:hypothetical protein